MFRRAYRRLGYRRCQLYLNVHIIETGIEEYRAFCAEGFLGGGAQVRYLAAFCTIGSLRSNIHLIEKVNVSSCIGETVGRAQVCSVSAIAMAKLIHQLNVCSDFSRISRSDKLFAVTNL